MDERSVKAEDTRGEQDSMFERPTNGQAKHELSGDTQQPKKKKTKNLQLLGKVSAAESMEGKGRWEDRQESGLHG